MKFLLADDHALFRVGIKHILQSMDPQAQVIEASRSQEAIARVADTPDLDLILLDLCMPDMDGFSAMNEIRTLAPASLIVILTASERLSDMRLALHNGAMGYIAKSTSPDIMTCALQLVLSGGVYIPPAFVAKMDNPLEDSPQIDLTSRQIEVLKLIIDGHSNKQVAHMLNLTEPTVKTHVSAIFKSMNVNNRTQAAMVAQRMNLDLANPK